MNISKEEYMNDIKNHYGQGFRDGYAAAYEAITGAIQAAVVSDMTEGKLSEYFESHMNEENDNG